MAGSKGESSAGPVVLASTGPSRHVGTPATPTLRETHPQHDAPRQTHNPAADAAGSRAAGPTQTVTDVSAFTTAHAATGSSSALSSAPPAQSAVPVAEGRPLPTAEPLATFSSPPARSDPGSDPAGSITAAATRASAPGRGPVGPTRRDVPSELNIGDEDLKGGRHRLTSPLDPLLAGLLSVFIVTTAIVFVALFLKFRQRANHPEFHRLQDLPMDDLMEDTPLSRYTY
ncbi:translation initiation factor IF-2-like [Betta splendens]|uniref:Translation initiation factor IF-2-like n=1 Tax=Betta splendens TaxID=158456 RepID=A0A6P7L0B2_BETSP|nr:translation initiation factor IF-2-like [Betta splendens]